MVLKVDDLQCPRCYKKIKKVLCKFPEIRDQAYDDKKNTVTITVVCGNPEKLRDKLCCKGGKTIQSIDIKPPPKPKEKPEKTNESQKPKEPGPACGYPLIYRGGVCCGSCYEGRIGGLCYHGYGRPIPLPLCYDNYGYEHYGYGRVCYVRNDYFSEENPSACTIM